MMYIIHFALSYTIPFNLNLRANFGKPSYPQLSEFNFSIKFSDNDSSFGLRNPVV